MGQAEQPIMNTSTLQDRTTDDANISGKEFWSDTLARLKDLEDTYGENFDFQMLLMSVEMGTFAEVRNFEIMLHGASLKVIPRFDDTEVRRKMLAFLDDLEQLRASDIEKSLVPQLRQHIAELESEVANLNCQLTKLKRNDNNHWFARIRRKLFG